MTLTLLLALMPAPASAGIRSGGVSSASTVASAASGSTPVESSYVLPLPVAPPASGFSRGELVERGLLLRDFVDPGPAWGAGHRGVDLSAAAGTTVLAPGAGTVTFAGTVVDRPLLVITHPDGLRSTLEPVTTELVPGSRVEAGAAIGTLAAEASTHCAPRHCLHWGVRQGEEYLDPLLVLGAVQAVILLPRQQRRRSARRRWSVTAARSASHVTSTRSPCRTSRARSSWPQWTSL